ncbi:MAG: NAD(P)-binding protein [Gammaproteobacteria bacterium]|nr:NAD(P)-binding protein [Gammaproteobacteria bacterium]
MKQYNMLIIGAGISGLSMAHYCAASGLKTLVLEKEKRPGGTVHSHDFDADDFWVELGAHSCFNSYGCLIGILEQLGLLPRLTKKATSTFKLLVDGRLKSIPSQLNFLELFLSLPRLLTQKKAGQSVAEYYGKIIGKRNLNKVFSPAFDAVIGQLAADYPADLLFKSRPRRKDILRSFTLPGGLQTITDTMAGRKDMEILTGRDTQKISFEKNKFVATDAEGKQYAADHLTVATPVSIAAGLLQSSFPQLAELLGTVRTAPVETMGVAVRKGVLDLPPLAGIIAAGDVFYSTVSRDTVPHPAYRGFTFHFKPGTLNQEAKRKRICEVLNIRPQELTRIVTKENRLPALRIGHTELVSRMDKLLTGKRLALTGNYFTGVSIEECVSRSYSEFSRLRSQQAL